MCSLRMFLTCHKNDCHLFICTIQLRSRQLCHCSTIVEMKTERKLFIHRYCISNGMERGVYIDTCLPFGLRSVPKLFNTMHMADFLAWILEQQGMSILMHYLDDFLAMGHPLTPECQRNLDILIQVCHLLNIPLAIQKVEGPTPCLDFLGIILDTIRMEAHLPTDKLTRIYHTVTNGSTNGTPQSVRFFPW